MRLHLRQALLATAAALALGGCGGGDPPAAPAAPVVAPSADYFPMGAGDRWLFDDGSSVRVCGTRSAGGETATVLRSVDTYGALQDESLYVKSADGVRELVADDADAFARAVGPLQQMRWPLVVGSAFTQVDKTVDSGLDVDGDGRTEPLAILSVVVVQGLEAVDVPAGRFDGCVHLRTLITRTLKVGPLATPSTSVSTGDEWFAPGVGIVKGEYLVVQPDQLWSGARALSGYALSGRPSEAEAPAVTELLPPDGSLNGAAVVVAASFSEAMDVASLREGGLQIVDDAGRLLAGRVTWRGLRASFVPDEPWAAGRYTARVSRQATDRVGNALAAERVWSFTVDPTAHPNPGNTLRIAPRPGPAPPTSAR